MSKREKELQDTISIARTELNEIEEGRLAKQSAALVGKCFVYQNSYSGDERWPLYTFITGVGEFGRPDGFRIEIDTHGKIECGAELYCSSHLTETECHPSKMMELIDAARSKLDAYEDAIKAV